MKQHISAPLRHSPPPLVMQRGATSSNRSLPQCVPLTEHRYEKSSLGPQYCVSAHTAQPVVVVVARQGHRQLALMIRIRDPVLAPYLQ